jgi:hypothetical protein
MRTVSFHVDDVGASRRAVDRAIGEIANSILQAARANTPVGETGELSRGWRIIRAGVASRFITNSVEYGPFVEYGTVSQRPQAMLGRAVEAARSRYGS